MKPFDLERAKAGDPVQTVDGSKARIICFDRENSDYPIVALIKETLGNEVIRTYASNGRYNGENDVVVSKFDLFMAQKTITKFVNIYKSSDGKDSYAGLLFDSIEEAKELANINTDPLICTQTLSWEE